jgi:hypothetical protein
VDAQYHLNLSEPETQVPVALRSYDAAGGNTFLLHAAHLALAHSFSEAVDVVIELDAGHDAGVNNGNLGGQLADAGIFASIFDVQEAYLTLTAPYGLSLTAGKFVTYQGIEVIEAPANPTLTRGFLFGLAEAFTHVGVKAHYALGNMADVGLGVVNGWDNVVDNNDAKTLIWRIGVTPTETVGVGFSGSWGAERSEDVDGDGVVDDPDADDDARLSLDLTGAVTPIEMLDLNFQFNYGREPGVPTFDPVMGVLVSRTDASWWGFGVQPVLTLAAFSAGLRIEYFNDTDGGSRTGVEDSYWNFTVVPGYTVADAWTARAEYRLDLAVDGDVLNGDSTQHTIAIGAHYVF